MYNQNGELFLPPSNIYHVVAHGSLTETSTSWCLDQTTKHPLLSPVNVPCFGFSTVWKLRLLRSKRHKNQLWRRWPRWVMDELWRRLPRNPNKKNHVFASLMTGRLHWRESIAKTSLFAKKCNITLLLPKSVITKQKCNITNYKSQKV